MREAEKYLKSRPYLIKEVIKDEAQLLQDKSSPSYGPIGAEVTIVDFFDYQCSFCSRMAHELEQIRQNNPNIRIVYKEWPIFKERWENSLIAARTGLNIWNQLGSDAYLAWHMGIFSTGHIEGLLTVNDINKVSESVGYKSEYLFNVEEEMNNTDKLARKLGFTGTPAIIIMPTQGVNADNLTVIPGYVNSGVIKAAVIKATTKG